MPLDLTEGQPPGHCIRCCWIGIHIGREIGLPDDEAWELYYTLLLKDLGCSSNAARVCELYLADDLTLKRDFKLVDGSLAAGAPLRRQPRRRRRPGRRPAAHGPRSPQNGQGYVREVIDTRCQRGADIARQMQFSEGVARGDPGLDEHWDGSGQPLGLKGKADPGLRRRSPCWRRSSTCSTPPAAPKRARDEVRAALRDVVRSRHSSRPSSASPASRHSGRAWRRDDLDTIVLDLEPAHEARPVDEDFLDDIAAAFAQVVDAKSPYTHDHSTGSPMITDLIAAELGIRRGTPALAAGGPRSSTTSASSASATPFSTSRASRPPEEWEAIKRHPAHTETILSADRRLRRHGRRSPPPITSGSTARATRRA